MKTRMIDGRQHCLIETVGTQSLWKPCEAPQLAASDTSGEMGIALFLAAVLGLGLTWGGSIITDRKAKYQKLFAEVKRGMR